MKFSKLNQPSLKVNVNITKYLIDWDRHISKPQTLVKNFLKKYWQNYSVLEEFPIPGSRLRIDILNLSNKIAIEVSPKSSHSFNTFFHKSREGGFLASLKRDQGKEKWINENGFDYICLVDEDLKDLTLERFRDKFQIEL